MSISEIADWRPATPGPVIIVAGQGGACPVQHNISIDRGRKPGFALTIRSAQTVAVVIICIATFGTSGCTGGSETVSADVPVATSGSAVLSAAPAAILATATAGPVLPTTPSPADPATAGRSAETAVPLGSTLTFYDRNAVGDKGAVTVLGIKNWDGTGPGDDSGVAVEVELTLAPDALIPSDSIVTTEPWSAVDKNGGTYRASWMGSGDPTPVYPHRIFIQAGETARGWILIGALAGVDDGSRPSMTSLTIRYELSDSKFLHWR